MFVVFDLETTGFSSIVNDVIQFAYIVYDSNNMIVRAESLYFYYEGMSWSEEAYQVHQISPEMLRQHADKFEENLVKMYATLMLANVCGHNAKSFDCPFATNWLSRMGLPGLQFRKIQDTMLQMRPISRRPKIKLIKLAEMLNVTDEVTRKLTQKVFGDEIAQQAHNAAFDTMRTALITIIGINKHYISFNDEAEDTAIYTDEDLERDDFTIPAENMLIRIREESGEVVPVLLTSQTQYMKDVDKRYDAITHTTQCLEGVFLLEENSPDKKVYVLRKHQSCIKFVELNDGCRFYLQLRDNLPEQEFYTLGNRAAFVNSFNSGTDAGEWRFSDV